MTTYDSQGLPLTKPGPLPWVFDDGGRAKAGYKGTAGDCVTRAIAIATGRDYAEVYADLNTAATAERPRAGRKRSDARTGVHRPTIRRYLAQAGWTWTPTMGIGTGTTVHLAQGELPPGRVIASVSKHLCAVIDGVVHDNHDPSRGGTRAVYGFWTKEED